MKYRKGITKKVKQPQMISINQYLNYNIECLFFFLFSISSHFLPFIFYFQFYIPFPPAYIVILYIKRKLFLFPFIISIVVVISYIDYFTPINIYYDIETIPIYLLHLLLITYINYFNKLFFPQ